MLDDVIATLEVQVKTCGVNIHVDGHGFTEHEDAAAAIVYLSALRHQRRQVLVGAGKLKQPVVRRRRKSAPPVPLQIDAEFNTMPVSVQVGGDLPPKEDPIVVKPQMPQTLHILGCSSRKHTSAVLTMESLPEEVDEVDDILTETATDVSEESEPESGQSEPESGQMKELSLLVDGQDAIITA